MSTDTTSEPTTNRGGAPKGNANRLVHGARSSRRHLFTLGKSTPDVPGDTTAHTAAYAVRKQLEAELGAIHGTLTAQQHSAINTAARIEMHVKQLDAWVRRDGRTEKELLDASAKLVEFAERRDRAIERLSVAGKQSENGLPALPQSALDELFDEPEDATGDDQADGKRTRLATQLEGQHAT